MGITFLRNQAERERTDGRSQGSWQAQKPTEDCKPALAQAIPYSSELLDLAHSEPCTYGEFQPNRIATGRERSTTKEDR